MKRRRSEIFIIFIAIVAIEGVLPGSFTHRSNRQITIKVEWVMNLKLANPLWVPVKALLCRTTTTRRRNLFTATAINSLDGKKEEVLVVVGGGAAGVYGAIRAKTLSPELRVLVIEKGRFLSKVKISGGGRCNVTNGHCTDTIRLAENYPRGNKELKGSFFYTHGPADTMSWFSERGVPLKTEEDGRVFPVSDSSASVVDCLLHEATIRGVRLERGKSVLSASTKPDGKFLVKVGKRTADVSESIQASYLLIATGSSPQGHSLATQFGHSIVDPVPSLFTFKINDPLLAELAGISFSKVQAKLKLEHPRSDMSKLVQVGPMLVTHWGLSGPVILRLSAWGARHLFTSEYKGLLSVDFIPDINIETAKSLLKQHKLQFSKNKVSNTFPPQFGLVNRFWRYILDREGSSKDTLWASLSNNSLSSISDLLKHCTFQVTGKGQYKDEFVTAGGVPLSESLIRAISSRRNQLGFGFLSRLSNSRHFHSQWPITAPKCSTHSSLGSSRRFSGNLIPELNRTCLVRQTNGFCSVSLSEVSDSNLVSEGETIDIEDVGPLEKKKPMVVYKKPIDFTKVDAKLLPTVMIIGRPNVGKSALYNRLIRRREALVYNTPDDHVTRDIREGIAKLGDLRFNVLDSAGIETEVSSGTILGRTTSMTANVLARTQFAVLIIDVRAGLHPLDLEVGKWLRKHAPQIKPIVVMNKSESIGESLAEVASEALALGFGEPTAISAETGLGMTALYEVLHPLLEDYMVQTLNDRCSQDDVTSEENLSEEDESKLPLQLAIVGRPNVGKSTMLNALLEEERVLVGPEAGLTRDAVRVQFEFQGRTVYMVDTAGWLERTERDKGPASLSIMQSRKSLMRAHIVALVLDAEEIIKSQRSMTHSEVVIARRAVEEGRGLVVIVNKMDCLRGKQNSEMYKKIKEAVPIEVQTVIPQITGIPVVFISALEGRGRLQVMNEVIGTYKRWCSRLSTGRLNRWLIKVMSRHSWKDFASQPKIKFFTQVKARPPTFVAFLTGKTQLLESDIRFLTKSLKDDFDLGGTPIRIIQRSVLRTSPSGKSSGGTANRTGGPARQRTTSDKRTVSV
ncbi:unnamed protein product [Brassica rapa]|uniref:GTPase Der n=1 Tax=Brassica campestris TaxID=3711 RepID=A0A8D9MEC1_BRACM|nr:unnamed protein product [Brassica rapa]